MWGNKKRKYHKKITSIIGSGTEIHGDVYFAGGLHLDGKVVGNLYPGDDEQASITISEFGIVEGEVHIPNVIINGRVEGDIYSSSHLELLKKACVNGNIFYHSVEIAVGAEVNGKIERAGATIEELESQPTLSISSDDALIEHQDKNKQDVTDV